MSHWYSLSPEWIILMCIANVSLRSNTFPHLLHLTFFWFLIWSLIKESPSPSAMSVNVFIYRGGPCYWFWMVNKPDFLAGSGMSSVGNLFWYVLKLSSFLSLMRYRFVLIYSFISFFVILTPKKFIKWLLLAFWFIKSF